MKSGHWSVEDTVLDPESVIHHKKVLGQTQTGKSGLGKIKPPPNPPKQSHAYRKLVADTREEIEENETFSNALLKEVQCNWTGWKNYIKNDFSWASLLAMPRTLSDFCLKATFNVLPSPSNLKRWHVKPFLTDPSCSLCGKKTSTTAHILTACSFSLHQRRFDFRHDSVLNLLSNRIKDFLIKILSL